MSREIYISSTPHETRLAIVEKDELTEIYYERENEYTLAGSIYNGRVTRVLPGMQSAFVDVGLERDAFLYITDFMEEQGEAADFESGEGRADSRSKNRDRGGRPRQEESPEGGSEAAPVEAAGEGERGSRRRHERGGRRPEPQRGPAEDEQGGFAPSQDEENLAAPSGTERAGATEDSENGEGSRRWRGRRGRRRGGRGPGDAPANGTVANAAEPAPTAAIQAEDDWAQPAEAAQPAAEKTFGRRDRGDRGSRRREGGGEREHSPRYPAADESEDIDLSASAEPIILPGESLSKYRRGGEQGPDGQAAHSATAPTQNLVALRPSTEVAPIAGWDGGSVLPGETLSRHRGPESERKGNDHQARHSGYDQQVRPAGEGSARDRRRERDEARGRQTRQIDPAEAVLPAVTSQHEPEPTALPFSDDAPAFEVEMTETRIEVESAAAEVPVYEPQTDVAAPLESTPDVEVLHAVEEFHEVVSEYEPSDDASASYRVDPAGPSEFRQGAPVLEGDEFIAAENETAAVAARDDVGAEFTDAEPAAHEFTTVQSTGEMISEAPHVPEAEVAPEEANDPAAPIEHERAVQSVHLDEAESTPMQPAFAPGDGELEEELLDEEDGDLPAMHAGAFEDTEEETLEGAADLGAMVDDMSIDRITQHDAADDEDDEDDFDIDEEEMEEDELEAGAEGLEETEEIAAADISEAEEEDFAEGFESGEHAEEPTAPVEGVALAPRRDEERRGRGDVRRGRDRGSRDGRRPGGNGRNGRPSRHSMQSTDLPAISDLLKPGQEVLVQIAKEPIAKKGARITSHIALPGRFLVFMPTVNHVGVSRKIESDGERRRLKEILLSEKGEASGGFIVRTAASGASEEELRSDLRFLLNLWADIKQRSEGSKSPALIYHDLNLVERVLRDQVSDSFSAIWVDTETEYERVLRFLQRFQPGLIRRVKLYTKETPLFEQFGITAEINKALRSKVWLKSGGSIVINQTEALVAIDINTGKYVGKTARLEDTIVKTNLDAIPEIVRQIRLRDLGGIIVIDFIDMDDRKNRHKVLAALEEELKSDRAPSKVLQFNDFGLVAITRKRVKQSLERTLSTTCGICAGTGMVKSPVTVCNEIYTELRKMHKHLDKGDVMLRVNPEVVKQLKSNNGKWLQEMEEICGKTILVKSDPALHPEQFDIH